MMQGKWFATTGGHVEQWGVTLHQGQGLTVETRIPRSVADQLHYEGGKLDGIGPGWYADGGQVDLINRFHGRDQTLAMIENIETPVGSAVVTWLTPSQGGRTSGPPTAPVYAANCTFPLGGEGETVPGWPATAEKFSLLLQKIDETSVGSWLCGIDFLARELVAPYLAPGVTMLVMEGPKVVGHATIVDVFEDVLRGGDGP